MNHDEAIDDVKAIIASDMDGFWLLMGDIHDPGEPRRREALMTILTEAWGKGYGRGLANGGRLLADAIIERVNAE